MCSLNSQSFHSIKSSAHCIWITWIMVSLLFTGLPECNGNEESDANLAFQLNTIIQRLFPMIPNKAKHPWTRIQFTDNPNPLSSNSLKSSSSLSANRYFPFRINPNSLINNKERELELSSSSLGTSLLNSGGSGGHLLTGRSRPLSEALYDDDLFSSSASASSSSSSSSSSKSMDPFYQDQSSERISSSPHHQRQLTTTQPPTPSPPPPPPMRPQWRKQQILGKRGPECMRRCIAQGILHPVQCHSLC